MKKIFNFALAACLILPGFFAFAGCGESPEQKAMKAVAGTYSNVVLKEDTNDAVKNQYVFDLKDDGAFTYDMTTFDGIKTRSVEIRGELSVDENKNIVDMEVLDIGNSTSGAGYIFGNILPPDEVEQEVTLAGYKLMFQQWMRSGVSFHGDYMIVNLYEDCSIMYKDDATKFAKDTVFKFYTAKDMNQAKGEFMSVMGYTVPSYEYDYYFVEDSFNLTNAADKTAFIEEIEDSSWMLSTDRFGGLNIEYASLEGISGFDLTTTGVRNGVITYKSNGANVEKEVTYKVVESDDELPENQLQEGELKKSSGESSSSSDLKSVEYIVAGTEIYELGWKFSYQTFDYDGATLPINEANCTGTDKIFTIEGYNKDATGYQVVTIQYLNKKCQQAVFVYNDTVNPVINAYTVSSSKVVITKTTVEGVDNYEIDYSNAKIELKKANGDTTQEVLTAAQTVDLGELKDYEGGDKILFAYNCNYGDYAYTYYVFVKVTVNVA